MALASPMAPSVDREVQAPGGPVPGSQEQVATSVWESSAPRNNLVASKRPCDVCRKRKIKCIPFNLESDASPKPGERCRGCENLDVKCSHDYVNKKPGRPLGSTKKLKEEKARGPAKASTFNDRGNKDGSLETEEGTSEIVTSAITSEPNLSLPVWKLPAQELLVSAEEPDPTALTPDVGRETFMNSPFTRNIDIRPSYSDGHPTPASHNHKISLNTSRDDDRGSRGQSEIGLWPNALDKSNASSVVDAHSPFQSLLTVRQGEDSYDTYQAYGNPYPRPPPQYPFQRSQPHDPARGTKRKASYGQGDDLLSPGRSVSSYTGGQSMDAGHYPSDDRRRSFSRRSSMSITRLIQSDHQPVLTGNMGEGQAERDFATSSSGNRLQRHGSGGIAIQSQNSRPTHRDSFASYQYDALLDPSLDPTMLSGNVPQFQFTHAPQNDSPFHQIEAVTSWTNVEFFIQLYLKHQHALVPIVHKPTFRSDLLDRRDRTDPEFRALLLSLVVYVICQVPVHMMTSIGYTKENLETLQAQCHYASKVIQSQVRKARWETGEEPNLTSLAVLIIDYFYSQNCNDIAGAATTLGEAARLAYVKKLHRTEQHKEGDSYDRVEDELRKRIFWQLYNTDKTDACCGMPVMLHDFEGLPPFPVCIDDDLINKHGMIPQPANQTSYITGFVSLSGLFQTLGECLKLFRQYKASPKERDRPGLEEWVENACRRIDEDLDSLPEVLRPTTLHDPSVDSNEVFAVQRVNLMITAVLAKFEIFDFKLELGTPIEQVTAEREAESRKICDLLHRTPIDHCAMNGEAMRTKLVRIMSAVAHDKEFFNDQVKRWWDVYAHMQFVQVIPASKRMFGD